MRLRLDFELDNQFLDIQYRKAIISFIKKSIQEYDQELYMQLYAPHSITKKSFTFAPILPNPIFTKENVQLSNNSLTIIFSIYNYAYALHLYNSFYEQKGKKFLLQSHNAMTLKRLNMIKERIVCTDSINVKFSSPLVTRDHNQETKKDMYYSFERPEFKETLKMNIAEQMKTEGLDKSLLNGFDIKPIQAKKAIIPVYEKMIECSLGSFELTGERELLDYLYKAGIGSKKAMGFGLFEIIN